MGAEVILTSDAWRDLAGIIQYIAKDNPAAAEQFSDNLLFTGVRMTVHGRYFVIDKVETERNRLLILRFWHSARDLRRLRLRA